MHPYIKKNKQFLIPHFYKKKIKNELILLLTFLSIYTNVFCQHKNVDLKKLKIQPASRFLIQGTSSLHDWKVQLE